MGSSRIPVSTTRTSRAAGKDRQRARQPAHRLRGEPMLTRRATIERSRTIPKRTPGPGIVRIVCLQCALVAAACSTQELAREHTLDIVRNVNWAFSRGTDLELAKAAFPASLKQMEGLLEMYPREPLLLRSLARGYLSYAFLFVNVPRTIHKGDNEFEVAQRREPQHELQLQRALGEACTAIRGYASGEVAVAYSRARELCQQLGDTTQLSQVLFALWGYYLVQGNLRTACELGEELLRLAQRLHAPALEVEAHWLWGSALAGLGDLAAARAHLEHDLSASELQQDSLRSSRDVTGTRIAGLVFLSCGAGIDAAVFSRWQDHRLCCYP